MMSVTKAHRKFPSSHFVPRLLWGGVWMALLGVAQAASLDEILARIDDHSRTLRSMKASIHQKKWTDILEEFDRGESGHFLFLREKGKLYLRKDIVEPQESVLVIRESQAIYYQPRIRQAHRMNLGQHRDKAEFMLLGFSSDQEALKKSYEIKLLGQDSVQDRQTWVLELTPRSRNVSAYFSKIVLWIDAELWVPIQQKLVEPTRDYLLIGFADIQINPPLSKSGFDLKLPKGTKLIGG